VRVFRGLGSRRRLSGCGETTTKRAHCNSFFVWFAAIAALIAPCVAHACVRACSYVGFAVPQVVFVDLGVLNAAPRELNVSGLGDVLCFHTAHHDWALATRAGKAGRFPYDKDIAAQARGAAWRGVARRGAAWRRACNVAWFDVA
jgi:glycerol dehydrogenase-like iron-containing ADH family enzyme